MIYSVDELIKILEIKLSKKRFTHSINVAASAKKLASIYKNVPEDKAYTAGLIHDICKEIPASEQLDMMKKSGRHITKIEIQSPPLFHAPAGAYYVEHVLGIHDEDILNAVRFHTIARENMSPLEEIVYLADLISADRDYKDVGKMRKLSYQSIEKAMLEALKFSISDITLKGSKFPHHTIDAYNYYVDKNKKTAILKG